MRTLNQIIGCLLFLVVSSPLAYGMGEPQHELEQQYHEHSERRAPKDGFPVLHNPELASADRADKVLEDQRWVIGFEHNGDARAYPVGVMGVHELVNDRVGGHPVAVCW